jgi:glycosyltransferase involved in cell wall biosynthesis
MKNGAAARKPLSTRIEEKMMKVLFDHQLFYQKYGGASKYFVMLINSMPKGSWDTTTLFSSNCYVKAKHLFRTYRYWFKGQALVCDYVNRPYTNFCLRRGRYDVFHQTNFGTYCLRSLGTKPMVTTYHDSNLSTIDPHPDIVARQAASLKRADAIVCVSENTKRDMLNLFDVDEGKVTVIYHGIEMPRFELLPRQRICEVPYVLYVGRRSEFKNFRRFVKAFSMLKHDFPKLKAVCTANPFTPDEQQMFKDAGVLGSMMHVAADETTMQQLYRDALFFAFPSRYEGFGMPILEAWSCHCPVVLSRASCFPEIAQDAGLYFDPEDEGDMYEKMRLMAEDEAMRLDFVDRGNRRVQAFTWEKCAQRHMDVYRSLV